MAARKIGSKQAFTSVVLSILLAFSATSAVAMQCEKLSELKLENATITSAQVVAAGKFELPGTMPNPAAFKELPAFCRVTLDIKPSKDSDIKAEVWLPAAGWNGKYAGQGNGGFAGSISYPALAVAVKAGYATASTDTGHTGPAPVATWALGHPDKIVDFGYRAIHEMTLKAKTIIEAFYGNNPKHSYFAGCSNGGRQALMEAQRFPDDYDGIIAGAPANYFTHLLTAGAWDLQATQNDPASYIPAAKIPALSSAVLASCDERDGLSDGLIGDPRECRFDPSALLCKGAESNSCLSAPQIAALKKLYAGPTNTKGQRIFPGRVVGGEEGGGGWSLWLTGSAPSTGLTYMFTTNFFANMVFNDPAWDFKTFNVDTGVKAADEKQDRNLNAIDPNLKAFRSRGGKLILYHGWSDSAISALNTIDYYNSVGAGMGERDTHEFVRLYMVPGMQHCFGGPGPNSFGALGIGASPADAQHSLYTALEQWVEKGTAPNRIIATKFANEANPADGVKMTRPLCPYPQTAKYKGSGDTKNESNFACAGK